MLLFLVSVLGGCAAQQAASALAGATLLEVNELRWADGEFQGRVLVQWGSDTCVDSLTWRSGDDHLSGRAATPCLDGKPPAEQWLDVRATPGAIAAVVSESSDARGRGEFRGRAGPRGQRVKLTANIAPTLGRTDGLIVRVSAQSGMGGARLVQTSLLPPRFWLRVQISNPTALEIRISRGELTVRGDGGARSTAARGRLPTLEPGSTVEIEFPVSAGQVLGAGLGGLAGLLGGGSGAQISVRLGLEGDWGTATLVWDGGLGG